jgi:hypothetical protein
MSEVYFSLQPLSCRGAGVRGERLLCFQVGWWWGGGGRMACFVNGILPRQAGPLLEIVRTCEKGPQLFPCLLQHAHLHR